MTFEFHFVSKVFSLYSCTEEVFYHDDNSSFGNPDTLWSLARAGRFGVTCFARRLKVESSRSDSARAVLLQPGDAGGCRVECACAAPEAGPGFWHVCVRCGCVLALGSTVNEFATTLKLFTPF